MCVRKNIKRKGLQIDNKPETPVEQKALLYPILWNRGTYIIAVVLLIMLLVLFSQYVFFDRLFLFKDIGEDVINGYWPYYVQISKYIRTEGLPLWSFSQGLGQNVFTSLGDIIGVGGLVYAVNPNDIPYVLVYVQMLKILLAGVFFFLFLKKAGMSEYVSFIGAAMYAFTGFIIVGAGWCNLATEAVYLALLFYSTELLIKNNNLLVFPVGVALCAINNPIFLYLDGLLLGAYLLFRYTYTGFSKDTFRFFLKAVMLGMLGIGIGAFIITGYVNQVKMSPRGGGNVSYTSALSSKPVLMTESALYYNTFLLRMLGNDMAGDGTLSGDGAFKGWYNYLEAPMQYCGFLGLLLIPQLFVLGGKRIKLLAGIAITAAIIPVIFPYFRYAFWLFAGDYFRTYSLFFDTLQILLSLIALELVLRKRKVNILMLTATCFVLIGLVFTIEGANERLKIPAAVFLLAETLIVWSLTRDKFFKPAQIILPIVVCVELVFMSWETFNSRTTMTKRELTEHVYYNDYSADAINYIHSIDNGFYRVRKNFFSATFITNSLNDASMQNFYSSPSYSSYNQLNYVRFLQKMNVIPDSTESATRWIKGISEPLLMIIISNKYLISNTYIPEISAVGYDSVSKIHDLWIYKNRLFLPLGFTYNTCVSEPEFDKMGAAHKEIMMTKSVVVDSAVLRNKCMDMKWVSSTDTLGLDTISKFSDIISYLRLDTLHISDFHQSSISGDINVSEKKMLFLSIPFEEGWKANIDGKEVQAFRVNYGFLGYLLDKGPHKIHLYYKPPFYTASMCVSVFSLLLYFCLGMAVLFKVRFVSLL